MKVLVTGAGGQLGDALARTLPERGHETVSLDRKGLDVADASAVQRALEQHAPDLVINAAAYTDVDGSETEREAAYAGNALAPRNLAQHCERLGCELLHVSTNYVFGGERPIEEPYTPYDAPDPRSVYAKTKLAGEDYVRGLSSRWYVVRTAGVYGEGRNFVGTMLRVGSERDSLTVKSDEYVSPTYAPDLAAAIATIAEGGLYGVYHVTGGGYCSWYEFAREIFRLSGTEVDLAHVASADYPMPAARPANGLLADPAVPALRHWKQALAEYLGE